jgi:hypothetical protein
MEQYLNAENFSAWRWDEMPEVSEAHKSQIVGGEICAWEYGNRTSCTYYDQSLPSVIVMSGDKFWNGLKREYGLDEEIAVTRAVLGAAVPDRFNVFGAIGDIYPPRSAEKPAYVEKIRVGKGEIERIIEVLSDASLFDGGDKSRSEVYKKCAEFALENLL